MHPPPVNLDINVVKAECLAEGYGFKHKFIASGQRHLPQRIPDGGRALDWPCARHTRDPARTPQYGIARRRDVYP